MAPEDRDWETTGLLRSGHRSERPAPLCLSYRLLVTLLNMAAMMLCFANQSSMGSTMVCMKAGEAVNVTDIITNTTTTTDFSVYNITTTIAGPGNGTELPPYKYDWDKTVQGWIHSSLFIGYYVTLLPSGILATRYGGKRLAVCGLFVSSLAQLATPLSAVAGVWWLCFVRAVCGFASGFVYAPIFGVLANWVPAAESSLLFGLAGTGIELGAVVSFSLSALFCESDVAGGWPLTYYVIGGLGLVTTLTFAFIVSDVPSQNRWISRRERHYIEVAVGEAGGHGHKDQNDRSALTNTIPIRSILTSVPVWAIVVSQTGSDWLYYLLITVMPSFMEEVMKLPSTSVTLVTGLPFLAIIPTIYVTGSFADFLRRKKILSTTAVRKLADFICKMFPGAILLGLTFLGPGQELEFVVLYLLTCILTAFIYLSWITNPVDLSPAYTGFITSICETGSMWIAIVVPIVVENLTKDKTVSQWRLVFTISFGIQVVTFLFYVTFGSSVLQPWGRPDAAPPGAVTHTADGNGKLPPASAERRRGRRRKSNFSASDSEVGRVKVYRSISSFASDPEDEQTPRNTLGYQPPGARLNGHVVVSPRQRPPSFLAASNPLYQDCVTSEWDNIYVTMTGSASASDSAAEEEDIYESMDFDSAAAALQRSGTASAAEKECPVYENVRVGAGPLAPSSSRDCSSSVPPQQTGSGSVPTSTSRALSSSIPPQQSSSGSVRTSASGEWSSVGNISERSARESPSYGTFGRT